LGVAERWEVELGRRLRALRLEQRLTQQELADRANVSLGAVKHLEQATGATTTTLAKVVRALGQEHWIDALAPPTAAFSPLELLEERRRRARRERARVRHREAPR
jgi:transcriptional regulator with XRE-family HTH domain